MRQTAAAIVLLLAIASSAGAEITLLESDTGRAVFEIVPGEAEVSTVAAAEREYVTLRIPGFGHLDETGRPEIPVRGVRLAVPRIEVDAYKILAGGASAEAKVLGVSHRQRELTRRLEERFGWSPDA